MYVKPNLNRSRAGIPQYQDPDRTNGMAKRPPEHILFIHPPSKRLCRALVATQPLSTSPAAGVTSPSLPVLPGSRSRKRSYQFGSLDERTPEEASVGRKLTRESTSGCFSDRCSTNNAPTCSRTGPPSYTISNKISDTAHDDAETEDCSYNSFQFWRSPLPAVDLSLLEDVQSQEEEKSKLHDSSDAMEI